MIGKQSHPVRGYLTRRQPGEIEHSQNRMRKLRICEMVYLRSSPKPSTRRLPSAVRPAYEAYRMMNATTSA